MAATALEEPPGPRRVGGQAEGLGAGVERQRPEGQRDIARHRRALAESPRGQHEQRYAGEPSPGMVQPGPGGRINPLRIIDDEDDRPALGQPGQHGVERGEHQPEAGLRVPGERGERGGDDRGGQVDQRGQRGGGTGERVRIGVGPQVGGESVQQRLQR